MLHAQMYISRLKETFNLLVSHLYNIAL